MTRDSIDPILNTNGKQLLKLLIGNALVPILGLKIDGKQVMPTGPTRYPFAAQHNKATATGIRVEQIYPTEIEHICISRELLREWLCTEHEVRGSVGPRIRSRRFDIACT